MLPMTTQWFLRDRRRPFIEGDVGHLQPIILTRTDSAMFVTLTVFVPYRMIVHTTERSTTSILPVRIATDFRPIR